MFKNVVSLEDHQRLVDAPNIIMEKIVMLDRIDDMSKRTSDTISTDEVESVNVMADMIVDDTDIPKNVIVSQEANILEIGNDIKKLIVNFFAALFEKLTEQAKKLKSWADSLFSRTELTLNTVDKLIEKIKDDYVKSKDNIIVLGNEKDKWSILYGEDKPILKFSELDRKLDVNMGLLEFISDELLTGLKSSFITTKGMASGMETGKTFIQKEMENNPDTVPKPMKNAMVALNSAFDHFNSLDFVKMTNDTGYINEATSESILGRRALLFAIEEVNEGTTTGLDIVSRVQVKFKQHKFNMTGDYTKIKMPRLSKDEALTLLQKIKQIILKQKGFSDIMKKNLEFTKDYQDLVKQTKDLINKTLSERTKELEERDKMLKAINVALANINSIITNLPHMVNEQTTTSMLALTRLISMHIKLK